MLLLLLLWLLLSLLLLQSCETVELSDSLDDSMSRCCLGRRRSASMSSTYE
jgi:hypothetical protein